MNLTFLLLYVIIGVLWFVNVPLIIAKPGSPTFRRHMDQSKVWMRMVAAAFIVVLSIHALVSMQT